MEIGIDLSRLLKNGAIESLPRIFFPIPSEAGLKNYRFLRRLATRPAIRGISGKNIFALGAPENTFSATFWKFGI
jgi:hypothetical protein